LLVRWQHGSEQSIPLTFGLNLLDFQHDTEKGFEEAKLWANLYKEAQKMDHGNHTDNAIPEYVIWHSRRVQQISVPPVLDPNYPLVEAPEDKLERLEIQNQRFRKGAQLVELTQKCQQLEIQNRQLRDQLGNSQIEMQGWVQDWVRESANNVKLKGEVK